MAKDKKFDDIFDSTAKKKGSSKKSPVKKSPAKKAAAAAPAKNQHQEPGGFMALNSALVGHHQEVLQRRAREDRYLMWSTALTAAITLFAFLTLYGDASVSWFLRFLVKLALCGFVAANALFAVSILDDNRKKMRDLLGVIVKINERFGFFETGRYDSTEESFFPNAYKFAGSDSEDEANLKTMFLKGSAAAAAFLIFFLV